MLKLKDAGIGISKPEKFGQAVLDLADATDNDALITTTVCDEQVEAPPDLQTIDEQL